MSYFTETRNVELSCLFYLETNLNSDWSGTTILKTFSQVYHKDTALPIVCVRLADTASTRLEVGADTLDNRYLLIIDLFARSESQRLDMADYIKNKLKSGWVHYDHAHSSGSSEVLTRDANGRDMVTEFVTDSRIDVGETMEAKDQHRHNISIRVRHTDA
jgi:hypothetical protein